MLFLYLDGIIVVVKMSREVFTNIDAAIEYLFSEQIDCDLAAVPPDVDELTDEDEIDDDIIDYPVVQDVPGVVEIINPEEEEHEEEEPIPSTSTGKTKSKRPRMEKPNVKWKKQVPEHNVWTDIGDDASVRFEAMKAQLQNDSPLQIFERFFSDDVFQLMVEETVRYARIQKNKHEFDVSVADLKVFIGFLLFSGYHTLPGERDYWSEEEDLGVNIVKNAFSRNAYLLLKAMIHFQDNSKATESKHDKGFKIRPLMELMNEKFQQWGVFQKHLSVDEMIVRYYGHHSVKQFIRNKPIRFGYKLWALCGDSGYCFHFSLYCGKETSETVHVPLGSRVVMNMLSVVDDPRSHVVFFDNFFTSYALLVQLKEKGFRATGTVRDGRIAKCPLKTVKEVEKLPRGTYDEQLEVNNDILAVRWNDNRPVTVATNYDTIAPMASVQRWSKEKKEKVSVQQPLLIRNYNKFMGGVDKHDWLLEKHAIAIRGKKWYWCLFTRMIDMAVVNACTIFKLMHGPNSTSMKDFRRAIAVSYLKLGHGTRVLRGRPLSLPLTSRARISDDIRYDRKDHVIQKRDKQRRCQFPDCKGKPLTYCAKCNVTLCTSCFPKFHQKP